MPRRCAMPCLKPGCPSLRQPPDRYCDEHKDLSKKEYPRKHPELNKIYSTKRWMDYRKMYLAEHPLCVNYDECHNVATVVHHKKDHGGDPALFFSIDNLQSLCKRHHDEITGTTKGWGRKNL